jgi:hypothetical protein
MQDVEGIVLRYVPLFRSRSALGVMSGPLRLRLTQDLHATSGGTAVFP